MSISRIRLAVSYVCTSLLLTHTSVAEDTGVNVTFKSVSPAGQLIGKRVIAKDGVAVGTLADVVLDRNRGRVVMFVVNSRRAANTPESNYFLPAAVVDPNATKNRLTLNVNFEDIEHAGDIVKPTHVMQLDDAAVEKLFQQFDAEPFWKSSSSDKQALSLITIDELDGRIIRDDKWQILARVKEVMVAPQDGWKVAYLGLGELGDKQQSSKRLAVPMAAFSQKTISPTWLLEVPADAALLKQTFERGEWPTEIDRGWIEFTHVKYGTSPVGGLQNGTPVNEPTR